MDSVSQPATIAEVAEWSTLSRNHVGPVLNRFGVMPLRRKYPMIRIYREVLGLDPLDDVEAAMLRNGLMRISKVAERFRMASEALLRELRKCGNGYPPVYSLGQRRNLMLRAQVEQMLASPRNAWHDIAAIPGHAVPPSRLSAVLEVPQSRIDDLLSDDREWPAHIVSQGEIRVILADARHRLASSAESAAADIADDPEAAVPVSAPVRGLFASAVSSPVTPDPPEQKCTRSGETAPGGGFSHGKPAEAKLSET